MHLVEVAVALPISGTFTYQVPERLVSAISVGAHVSVPFGRRRVNGVVLKKVEVEAHHRTTSAIEDLLDAPPLGPQLLRLAHFISKYYGAPIGEVIRNLLPRGVKPSTIRRILVTSLGKEALTVLHAALRRSDLDLTPPEEQVIRRVAKSRSGLAPKTLSRDAATLRGLMNRGLIRAQDRTLNVRQPSPRATPSFEPEAAHELTNAQQAALSALEQAIERNHFKPFLLHGVTGSGKTEVYLRAAGRTLEQGRQALVLVPEIALTPQLAARFRSRFGDRVAVLHSELPPAQRVSEWNRLLQGTAKVALGARSAIFAPLDHLGLVVVDEEHDASYKQQDGVRYHARDLAFVRARDDRAVVVVGSATPSLESYQAARRGRYQLLHLPNRVTPQPLPEVELIDLRIHLPDAATLLSARFREALRETLDAGQQAIVLLNRRGFATLVLCRDCGTSARCRDCSVAQVWHLSRRRLICHWCGRSETLPDVCPSCGGSRIEPLGVGTERIEAALRELFPAARVARVDRDSVQRGLSDNTHALAAAARGEVDILIGTQMLAKGHDLPGVTMVGVVLADVGMNIPDFRATERTFQLITQVAGRAGRGAVPGRVLVQTFQPEHPALRFAARHDYEGFFTIEAKAREELGYPPFGHVVLIRIEGPDLSDVERRSHALATTLRRHAEVRVMGPSPSPIARARGRNRWQIALCASERRELRPLIEEIVENTGDRALPRVLLDVDPVSMV